MVSAEVQIAQLSHLILGEPEEHIDRFKEFFDFGVHPENSGQQGQTSDLRLRTLALLSATAVLIDIFPDMIVPTDGSNDTEEEKAKKKASRDHQAKLRRAKLIVELFDQLLQKLNKLKIVRGVATLLKSPVCSRQCLDQRRIQQLVSSVVSMAANPAIGKEACVAIRDRIRTDFEGHVENLEIVKFIVLSITKEKQQERINALIPLLDGIRFLARKVVVPKFQTGGAKMDRQLKRDLATGRADYVDVKKIKSAEAEILSEAIALYIRTLRSAQTGGQYSFKTVKTCIEGLASNCGSVNMDLASELEGELIGISKFYLTKNQSSEEEGMLGAVALSALLNITKKERAEILTGSVIGGLESLIPIALERMLQYSRSDCDGTLTALCKGAIGLSAQFGSENSLLAVARALVTALCMGYYEQSKLASDLLVNVASRSALVRTAIDPEGVLVDGPGLSKEEISLFPQLHSLIGNCAPDPEMANKLLGNLSKYSRDLATRVRADAITKTKQETEISEVEKKRAKIAQKK